MTTTTNEVQEHLDKYIKPVLDHYGATIVSTDPEAHLKVEPLQRFIVMVIEYQGEQLELSGGDVKFYDPKPLKFFFEHYQELQTLIKELSKIDSPFHSNVYLAMKDRFGRNRDSSFAYCYVCRKLEETGKTITCD